MAERHPAGILVIVRPNGSGPPGLEERLGGTRYWRVRYADEIPDEALSAEIAYVWNFRSRLVAEQFHRFRDLRWIHVSASGVDAVLSPEVRRSSVLVTNTRGVTAQAMAEYALGLMLFFAKDVRRSLADQATRTWHPRETETLSGQHLLIIGVGMVGRCLARLANAAGMHVRGIGRTAHPAADGFEEILASSELLSAASWADYLVVAAPHTPETENLVNKAVLGAMRPSARLINVSRGRVVDEPSLVEALQTGQIAGAGLDVFWHEPLPPTHPLWSLPNVLISPHVCGDFIGWEERMFALFLENLRRWRCGEELLNIVDKELGYVPSGRA